MQCHHHKSFPPCLGWRFWDPEQNCYTRPLYLIHPHVHKSLQFTLKSLTVNCVSYSITVIIALRIYDMGGRTVMYYYWIVVINEDVVVSISDAVVLVM